MDIVLAVGQSVTLRVAPRNSRGEALGARTATWRSSDPTRVTVGAATGVCTRLATGDVTVTAEVDGILATATLTTGTAPVPVPLRPGTIIGDGNSLLAGVGIDNSGTSYLDGNVVHLLGARYGCPAVNYAVSGQTTTQMLGDAAAQIDPAYDAAHTPDVLVLWELRNEYATAWAEQDTLLTARAVLDKLWTYVDARRAAHPWAVVVVLPVLPTSQSNSNSAGHPFDNAAFETWRGQINGLLSSEAAAHGCRVPTLPDAVMAFGANHDRAYYREDIHLNAAGYALVEPAVAAAIDAALAGLASEPAVAGFWTPASLTLTPADSAVAVAGAWTPNTLALTTA